MKIKKINIVRPEVEVEFHKGFVSWCYFVFAYFRFVRIFRMKYNISVYLKLMKNAAHVHFKTLWFICIPKVQIKKGDEGK